MDLLIAIRQRKHNRIQIMNATRLTYNDLILILAEAAEKGLITQKEDSSYHLTAKGIQVLRVWRELKELIEEGSPE